VPQAGHGIGNATSQRKNKHSWKESPGTAPANGLIAKGAQSSKQLQCQWEAQGAQWHRELPDRA